MAITYQFYCPKCKYQDELFAGTTILRHLSKQPSFELASCPNCLKLVATTTKKCPTCNLGINKWFQLKKKGLEIIDTRNSPLIIECPNCGNKEIKSTPMLFSD